jgi:hypothetical protein
MNRIQFFILVGLSSLILLLLVGHIFLTRQQNFEQNRLAQAQQVVNQGQVFQGDLKQLAIRIFQDSQKTNDPGLKSILEKNQITYTPAPAGSDNGAMTPAPNPPASNH